MSKAEEMIKTKLKRMLKAQASYILNDKTINDNQKMEQMMVIEELMKTLNKENVIEDMNMHEYTLNRTQVEITIDKMQKEKEEER